MSVQFEWGQISVAATLGGAVGIWIGHRLAIGRDERKEFVEAGKQFRESFVRVRRLLAARHRNHIGGEEFEEARRLLPSYYNALFEAKDRFQHHLSVRSREKFLSAWNAFCCMRGQPPEPTFQDYNSGSDHIVELTKRDLAISRIDELFKFTK